MTQAMVIWEVGISTEGLFLSDFAMGMSAMGGTTSGHGFGAV